MKKYAMFILIPVLVCSYAVGQETKLQLSLSGGLSSVFQYGSEEDYVAGENDFPVTPSHMPPVFGLSASYSLSQSVSLGLTGRYCLASKVTLTDPSDQDTVKFNTSPHISFTGDIFFELGKGKFIPYLVAGGGIDYLMAKDEMYVSEYGYEIEFLAPDRKIDPVINAGGGIRFMLNPGMGVELDVRYAMIFAKPDNISCINTLLGVFFRF